jgi:hypothetical protein
MRLTTLAIPLLCALTGCAELTALTSTISPNAATVSGTTAIVAANAYDAIEATATNYIGYCTPNPKPIGCSVTAIQKYVPAVRSGRLARNAVEQFVSANPAGTAVPIALYNGLTSASSTLQAIEAQYPTPKKS